MTEKKNLAAYDIAYRNLGVPVDQLVPTVWQ